MPSPTGVLAKYSAANKLYKGSLLNAVCFVASLSVFFFGYDQGKWKCLPPFLYSKFDNGFSRFDGRRQHCTKLC